MVFAFFPQKLRNVVARLRAFNLLSIVVLLGLIALGTGYPFGPSTLNAIELSDIPMFSRVLPPPANIMFVLDDSGSMNFEILVRGEYDGTFPNPNKSPSEQALDPHGFCYVFDDVGDNVYGYLTQPEWYAGPEGRKYWKLSYFDTNLMYYNPKVHYFPWPSYAKNILLDADVERPRSHPVNASGCTLDLRGKSFTVETVDVPHSYYFVYSAIKSKPYLVVIDMFSSSIRYFEATVSGQGLAEKVEALTPESNPPADVKSSRTYHDERQNFANWFTYHRRREFTAKNLIANLTKSLSEVRIGIYGINQKIVVGLEPVKVTRGTFLTDHSDIILEKIYPYRSEGGTPLKQGLDTIGAFYKNNTGNLAGVAGPKPYDESELGAACQQSFTVVLTDGFYSDISYARSEIGNADGENGSPYADSASNTLADIAMYYYENDLNDLPDRLPASKSDRATHQHMVTCAVPFGVSGTLKPCDYGNSYRHKDTGRIIQWPVVPDNYRPEAIDDLWHATVNSRGRFLNAFHPLELADALKGLMASIMEVVLGSASSVIVNGNALYGKLGNETHIYRSSYRHKESEWTGDIEAFSLDPKTGNVHTSSPIWSAARKLKTKEWSQRLIATFNGTDGIPFRASDLTPDQLKFLGAEPEKKVEYLRGAAIDTYRLRSQPLGDIVSSTPIFFKAGAKGYIFCGANDGMLHAFDAATGEELFAYIPNLVFPQLKQLADPGYVHQFYVDLTPSLKEGIGVLGGNNQKAIVVGGLGKGGKGYFALDITDPKTITSEIALAKRALWEFPKSFDADMGYSFSKPVIVQSNNSAFPWVVIFGNGFSSDSGKSVLFIVKADNGELIKKIEAGIGPDNGLSSPAAVDVTYDGKVDFVYAGDLKGNLWKFDLSSSNIKEWKVAFSDGINFQPLFQAKGPANSLQPITTTPDVMYHPEKHGFIVCFGTGQFLGDADISEASTQSIYGIWDYGDRFFNLKTEKWSPDDDREFLGVFDRDNFKKLSNQPYKVSLKQQTQLVFKSKTDSQERNYRFISNLKPTWMTKNDPDNRQKPDPSDEWPNHAGYYCDLGKGERVITDVVIRGGHLIAIGYKPGSDPCDSVGTSIFMELDAFTGGRVEGSLFDINADQRVDQKDLVKVDFNGNGIFEELAPSGIEFSGNLQLPAILGIDHFEIERKYMSSSTGRIETLTEKSPKVGITYWMEVRY